MEHEHFFQELYQLIEQIYPQMIGYYMPILLSIHDPRDPDILQDEDCFTLFVGDKKCPTKVIPYNWQQPEDILSAEVLQTVLDHLPDNFNSDATEHLQDLAESFRQIEDPDSLRAALETVGPNIHDMGELFFSMRQSMGTILTLRSLQEKGMTREACREYYRHGEAMQLIDYLLGRRFGENDSDGLILTEMLPIPDNFCRDDRNALGSAFLMALISQCNVNPADTVVLCSDIVNFPHHRAAQILAVIVDASVCQPDASLLHPVFSDSDDSFLQQAIRVLFQKFQDIHQYALYSSNSNYIMDVSSVIRLAVRDLTEGRGLPPNTLFDSISAARSEGAACYGTLVFSKADPVGRDDLIRFEKPVLLQGDNVRYVRKLLEMTGSTKDDDYALVALTRDRSRPKILGLAPRSHYPSEYRVEFHGLMKWTLFKGNKEVVSFEEGAYIYHKKRFDEELKDLRRYLQCTEKDMDAIRHIISTAWEQKHGAMLIIFCSPDDAAAETERLVRMSRGIQLKHPCSLVTAHEKLLLSLSSIDGAILLDKSGFAFGFGMIVDGEAVRKGQPQRGARYNSANNYVECCKGKNITCAALVVSEDRSLDVLFPQRL